MKVLSRYRNTCACGKNVQKKKKDPMRAALERTGSRDSRSCQGRLQTSGMRSASAFLVRLLSEHVRTQVVAGNPGCALDLQTVFCRNAVRSDPLLHRLGSDPERAGQGRLAPRDLYGFFNWSVHASAV